MALAAGQIDAIDGALMRFERALLAQVDAHAEVMILATYLQRAQPIHRLLAYVEMAERIGLASRPAQTGQHLP